LPEKFENDFFTLKAHLSVVCPLTPNAVTSRLQRRAAGFNFPRFSKSSVFVTDWPNCRNKAAFSTFSDVLQSEPIIAEELVRSVAQFLSENIRPSFQSQLLFKKKSNVE